MLRGFQAQGDILDLEMASPEGDVGLSPQAAHDFDAFRKNTEAATETYPTHGKLASDDPPGHGRGVCHAWASRVSPGVHLAFMYTSYTGIARKIHAGV